MIVRNFQGGGPEEILETLPRNVDLSLKKINYTETREGRRHWSLVADSAAHNAKDGTTRLKNIRMTFYGQQGDYSLTAANGEMQIDTRRVSVWDDVVIESPQGFTLYTERLDYNEKKRQVRSDRPIHLVSDRVEIDGVGMTLDVESHSLKILSAVEARFGADQHEGRP